MIDPGEMLFAVDKNNQPIAPVPRKLAHEKAIWHRVTDIWVINSTKVLCQQRSHKKDTNPGKWQVQFGGHMAPGQSFAANAVIELREETGIELPESSFTQLMIHKNSHSDPITHIEDREFLGVMACEWNGDVNNIHLEEDEVQQVVWKEAAEIQKHIGVDPNWVNHGYEQELLPKIIDKNWGEL